jgi:hypothetical protein
VWPYGSCVDKVTGALRYLAPTTVQKADPNDHHGGGCLRKFFYRYALGLKEEERDFQSLGVACHSEIETHLLTGANTLGRISSAVKPYLPAPDIERARLLVEHDIGGGSLEAATFGVEGVPFVGYTDVIRANDFIPGLNLKPDGEAINEAGDGFFDDPPDTIEALDWKFGAAKKGADRDFSMSGPELASDTQMITLAAWALHKSPSVSAPIRVSHVYTNTKGRPESSKASTLITRENLLKRWEYVGGVVRSIKDVARERDPERVPGNKHACESFGGCPYAGAPCRIPMDTGLETFFGGDDAMSILDDLNIPGMSQPTPTVTASPAGVAANLGIDISSQMAALAAATEAPAWKPTQPTKEFVEAVAAIHAKGYGMVPLTGDAAQMFGVLNRHENVTADYKYPGSGDLAKTAAVADPARVIAISREMAALPVKAQTPAAAPTAPAPLALVSPETPKSDPAKASLPVEGFAHPTAVTPDVQIPGLMASVPATAAAQTLAATATPAPSTNVAATVTTEAPKEPARRGRKPKAPKADGAPAATNEPGDDARWLFINAIPNVAYEDCARYVSEWAQGAARHFKLAAPYDDIRLAPNDSPLGYGKGLAALSSVAKNAAHALPAGAYYINTESELAAAVAEGFSMARGKNPDGTDGDPVFELIVRGVPRRG